MRTVVKVINSLLSVVMALALLIAGTYAAYCLWDNQQIYTAVDHVQAELHGLKPKAETGEQGPTFDELLAVNPDVRAWITMDGTKIDHPVLQGESNLDYINTDVYGNFALAGSIFLDSRNEPDFSDTYSVLYGHHMEKSAMFGDLDKYLDREFFDSNRTGELMVPGHCYALQVFACIQAKASDDRIFEPYKWQSSIGGLLDYAETESVHFHAETIKTLRETAGADESVQILALTTCSSDFTDARTIVLAVMSEKTQGESGDIQP